GFVLVLFAVMSAFRYDARNDTLINFALGVMSFAFTGMLGVFLTALLTRRGNNASVLAALITGVIVTALLQDGTLGPITQRRLRTTTSVPGRRLCRSTNWRNCGF